MNNFVNFLFIRFPQLSIEITSSKKKKTRVQEDSPLEDFAIRMSHFNYTLMSVTSEREVQKLQYRIEEMMRAQVAKRFDTSFTGASVLRFFRAMIIGTAFMLICFT